MKSPQFWQSFVWLYTIYGKLNAVTSVVLASVTIRPVCHGGSLILIPDRECGIYAGLSSECERLSRSNSPFLSQYFFAAVLYPFFHSSTQLSCMSHKFEINSQLFLNLCTYIGIAFSLFLWVAKQTSTRAVFYTMFGSVSKIKYERIILKLVQIWLVVCECCKIRWKQNCRFCKTWGRFTSFIL